MKTKGKVTGKKVAVKKITTKKVASSAVKKEKTKRVTFSVRAKEGSKVSIAGSFNGWDPTAKEMKYQKREDLFVATLNLPVGAHEYKFVIDGIWCADPECPDWIQNDLGTLNSVKVVE